MNEDDSLQVHLPGGFHNHDAQFEALDFDESR